MSLKKKTVTGSFWNLVLSLATTLTDFIVFAVLARYLSIEEFGVLLFCLLVVEFAGVFTNVGVNHSLVQRKQWSDEFASSAFYVIGGFSLVISIIVATIGTYTAFTYHSLLASLTVLALSAIPTIVGLQAVFSAKLERDFKNKLMMYIRSISSVSSGMLIVVLVYFDFGIWSLVIGKLINQFFVLLLFIVYSKIKLVVKINKKYVKELISFSLPLLGIAILNFLKNKMNNIVTAPVLGSESFAMISVARKGQDILGLITMTPINRMIVPVMSRVEMQQKVQIYYRLLGLVSLLVIPAFLGLGAVSESFIVLSFGDKFAPASALLAISTLSIVAVLIGWFLPNMLISIAQTKAALNINIIAVVSTVVVASSTVWFGMEILIAAFVIQNYLTLPIRILIVKKYYELSIRRILKSLIPAVVSSIFMVVVIKLVQQFYINDFSHINSLLLSFLIGSVTYLLTLFVIFPKIVKASIRDIASLAGNKS
jgi:O-antigen/teichoic acid export membrane protein